jgi:L-ribulose-5-phosphate 3-epimerase
MKKGINQWLFPDTMRIEDCMALAKDAGFDGIELALNETSGSSGDDDGSSLVDRAGIGGLRNAELTLDSGADQLESIRRAADKIGINISAIATTLNFHYPLTSPDQVVRQKGVEVVRQALRVAKHLRAGVIIVIPGMVTAEVTYEQALARSRDAITALLPEAERAGVVMGLENVWNKFLLSPVEFRDFVDGFESRWVGAFFDVANILVYGYPQHWIRTLAERIKCIHVKDFKESIGNIEGFVNMLRGDVDWPEVLAALGDVGYDGYLTVESIPAYKHFADAQVYEASIALDRLLAHAP